MSRLCIVNLLILLLCRGKESESEVTQLCSTLCNPMDCSPSGSLDFPGKKVVDIFFSRGSAQPRDWTQVSHIAGRLFTCRAIMESMQSTSCKMTGWINHKLESTLLGEMLRTSDIDDTTLPLWQKGKRNLLMRVKEEIKKAGLKCNIQETKIMASGPINLWQQMGKMWKQWQIFFPWAQKSLRRVTAATKLYDTWSLEEKIWQT